MQSQSQQQLRTFKEIDTGIFNVVKPLIKGNIHGALYGTKQKFTKIKIQVTTLKQEHKDPNLSSECTYTRFSTPKVFWLGTWSFLAASLSFPWSPSLWILIPATLSNSRFSDRTTVSKCSCEIVFVMCYYMQTCYSPSQDLYKLS